MNFEYYEGYIFKQLINNKIHAITYYNNKYLNECYLYNFIYIRWIITNMDNKTRMLVLDKIYLFGFESILLLYLFKYFFRYYCSLIQTIDKIENNNIYCTNISLIDKKIFKIIFEYTKNKPYAIETINNIYIIYIYKIYNYINNIWLFKPNSIKLFIESASSNSCSAVSIKPISTHACKLS